MAQVDDRQRQQQQAVARRELLEAPVGVGHQSWILWKPGIDPTASYSRVISSAKLRRIGAVTGGIVLTAIVPYIAILLIGSAFHASFWLGMLAILGGIPIVPSVLGFMWEGIGKTRVDCNAEFASWVKNIDGKECFASRAGLGGGSDSPGARRLVRVVKAIQDSYAMKTGWLSKDTLDRTHEDAWNSIARAGTVSAEARDVHLAEVADRLEFVAVEVAKLDDDLRFREKSGELELLRDEYVAIKDRATALSEDVKATRQFLVEYPD